MCCTSVSCDTRAHCINHEKKQMPSMKDVRMAEALSSGPLRNMSSLLTELGFRVGFKVLVGVVFFLFILCRVMLEL